MFLPPKCRRRSLLLGLALLAACHAVGGGRAPGPVVKAPKAASPDGIVYSDPAVEALFRTLGPALTEGDDELAGRILLGLRARALGKRELELVASAERVLRGRALVRGLELELVSESVPGSGGNSAEGNSAAGNSAAGNSAAGNSAAGNSAAGNSAAASHRLVLVARTHGTEEVELRLPPCDLKRLRASMDARGLEGLDFESKASSALADLAIEPGVERRVELLTYELPLGRALGVRERWRVETRSGEIACAGESFPAANVRVTGCERERLSPLLAGEPARPRALAERLGAETEPSTRELLELALRIESGEREAALDALAPAVAELARTRPARILRAEPALRWLTQNRDIGPDAAGWAHYLEARVAAGASEPVEPGALDLPAQPRGARREERGSR